LLKQNILFF
jgi:hypothetical protein